MMKTSADLRALAIRLGAPSTLPPTPKKQSAKAAYNAIAHPSWLHWLALRLAPHEEVAKAHAWAKLQGHRTYSRELYATRYCEVFREMIPFEMLREPGWLPWYRRAWAWFRGIFSNARKVKSST